MNEDHIKIDLLLELELFALYVCLNKSLKNKIKLPLEQQLFSIGIKLKI